MLVFSYGIPKSGSTLAFRLATGVAMLGGHRQSLLPDDLRAAEGHKINFAQDLDAEVLPAMAAAAGDRILVVKTHALPGPAWIAVYERLAARGLVSAHVNHRDPRDICLALLDAGAAARAKGEQAFSEFVTLDDAAAAVGCYLDQLDSWTRLPRGLALRYELCAFQQDAAIDAIKADFAIRCPNWMVKLYADRIAFTHRNKAVPERHRHELDAADIARLTHYFAPYLDRMGYAMGGAGSAIAM